MLALLLPFPAVPGLARPGQATPGATAGFTATAFPASVLGIKTELLINGAWIDITPYVYQRADITISARGRPDETSGLQPAQMTLTLNNRDNRFSSRNSAGAYWPFLTRNTQIRVSVTAASATGQAYSGYRFWGEVSAWPQNQDETGTDIWVTVTAAGLTRRLNQAGQVSTGSALSRYYTRLDGAGALVAYWTCEDGTTASSLANTPDPAHPMTWTGTPALASGSAFAGSDPLPVLNSAIFDGLVGDFGYSGDDVFTTPGTWTWICPQGITSVDARCWGAGGGGYHGSTSAGGGGGGGGEFAEETALAVTPGNSYSLVVGTGGTAAGGTSTFPGDSVTVTAHGGAAAVSGSGAAGGTGSANTAHFNGGAGSAGVPAGSQITQTFTGSGTWISLVTSVKAECWGGGGGGADNAGADAGGGGGEYAAEAALAVTRGKTYSFTVGPGGKYTGGNGYPGQATEFPGDSVTVTAHGGKGGASNTPGAGGTGSANTTHHNGGAGGTGSSSSNGGGGGGGGSGGTGSAGNAGGNGTSGAKGAHAAAVTGGGPGGDGGYGSSKPGYYGKNPGGNYGSSSATRPGGGGGGAANNQSATIAGWGAGGQIKLTYISSVLSGGGGGGSGGTAGAGTTATTASGATAVTGGGPGGDGGAVSQDGSIPVTGPGGGGGGAAGGSAAPGWAGQVEIIYTPVQTPAANIVRFLLSVPSAGATHSAILLRILTTGTIARLDVAVDSGSTGLTITGYNSGGTQLFTGTLTTTINNTPMLVSAELTPNGTAVNWKLQAILPGAGAALGSASGTQAAASLGAVTEIKPNVSGTITDTAVGHFAIQYALTPITDAAYAANGYTGELAGTRFLRLMTEQGYTGALVGNASDTPAMGPQKNQGFAALLQECEDVDRGITFEPRNFFGLAYRTQASMHGQNPVASLDYAAAQMSGTPAPTEDDQLTRNDITVSRVNGSSYRAYLPAGPMSVLPPPDGVGEYPYSPSVNCQADTQLAGIAGWILAVGTVDELRWPDIEVNMARAAVAPQFANLASLDVGDFLQLLNTPAWTQTGPVNQLAWGFAEILNAFRWEMEINGVPESPWTP